MNRYDQLPITTKAAFALVGFAPALYAGWRQNSWLTGVIVFGGGIVLAMIIRQIIGAACVRVNTDSSGNVDKGAVNECFIWPFLFAGPVGAGIAAWVVLKLAPDFLAAR